MNLHTSNQEQLEQNELETEVAQRAQNSSLDPTFPLVQGPSTAAF